MRVLAFAALALFAAASARAENIAIALTDDVVEVDAGFAGAEIVLFGALVGEAAQKAQAAGELDVVAVLRGPPTTFRVRPMVKERLIWIAGPAVDIRAPGLFHAASTRPLADIADATTWRALRARADAVILEATAAPSGDRSARYLEARGAAAPAEALLADASRNGRFRESDRAVAFRKNALFSVRLELPPATPVGDYEVEVFLMRGGEPISRDAAALSVRKVGIERDIYNLAHEKPVSYGIACVLVSLAAGWIAAAAFRKS